MNNYNSNDNGLSINIELSKDEDLARFYFDESIQKEDDQCFYVDCGNIDLQKIDIWQVDDELDRNELVDSLIDVSSEEYNFEEMNNEDIFEELQEQYSLNHCLFSERLRALKPFLKNKIESIYISGHSQGDYATIYYFTEILREIWGHEVNESELKKELENIFYNHPLNIDVQIENKEYYAVDFDNIDIYEQDTYIIKDEILKVLKNDFSKKEFIEIKEYLNSLEYV